MDHNFTLKPDTLDRDSSAIGSMFYFEISLNKNIKDSREFVFDWWTDLQPEDSKLVRPLKSRRIISRSADKIRLHDTEQMYFKKMEFDVEVTLQRPERWISEYRGKSATAKSVFILKSESNGTTTLNYRTKIHPMDFLLGFFSLLVKPFVKNIFIDEMDVFIKTLENKYFQFDEQKKKFSSQDTSRT